jgi:hypothetical protein
MATAVSVGGPVVITLILYIVVGLFTRKTRPAAYALLHSINLDSTAEEHLANDIKHDNETSQEFAS